MDKISRYYDPGNSHSKLRDMQDDKLFVVDQLATKINGAHIEI